MSDAADPPKPERPASIDLRLGERAPKTVKVIPNRTNTLRLIKGARVVHRLELEDVNFHTDSAVLLPAGPKRKDGAAETAEQARLEGLLALRTVIMFCELNPEKLLLIAGHTDTTGSDAHNQTLSRLRAENVLVYLRGDRAGWVASCEARHKGEDLQAILAWVAETKGWDTDPGTVDGIVGPNTRDALTELRRRWSSEGRTPPLPASGPFGTADWGAFYDLYDEEMARLFSIEVDGLAARRAVLKFVDPAAIGCGEKWPIDKVGIDNHRSRANRRVELLLFDEDEVPPLDCHAGGGCKPELCVLYDPLRPPKYRAEHIPADVRSFKFLLEAEGGRPWSDAAVVRIASEDGTHERTFELGGAPRRRRFRALVFPDARPGLRYAGEIVDGERTVQLFAPVELFLVQDPGDPTTRNLPLPVIRPPDDDGPPTPLDPNGAPGAHDFDPEAVAAAAEDGIPRGFLLALPAFGPDAVLRVVSEDGSDDRRVPLAAALAHGELKRAGFGKPKPGLRYRGEVIDGGLVVQVFGAVELARVLDPADDLGHLPLPELPPHPEDGPASPADDSGPAGAHAFDPEAVDAAAEAGLPRGFLLALPSFGTGAALRLTSEDGRDVRTIALDDARAHGGLRALALGRPRAGARHRGEVVLASGGVVPLFGPVDLARLLDPADPLDHLPLPTVALHPPDGPPAPDDPSGAPGADGPDPAASDRAADVPPVPVR